MVADDGEVAIGKLDEAVRPLQNLPKIVTSGQVLKTPSYCNNRHV